MAVNRPKVVIIGGGIAGVGLAAGICQHCDVVLLEQESRPAYHSTGRSAAIFIESYGNDVIRTLNRASLDFFKQPDGVSDRSLLRRRGMLLLGTDEDAPEISSLLGCSSVVQEINIAEAVAKIPVLNTERFTRVVFEPGASDIDVDLLHQGWLQLARASGVQLAVNSMVTDITKSDNQWHVQSGSATYSCDIVVNAAGAWADQVAQLAGVPALSLSPLRRSAAMVQLGGDWQVSDWPLFANINETWYAKPEAGQLMVSPADEDPVDACDAWVDDLVLAAGIDRFESAITAEVTKVKTPWAGLRTFAPDKTPVAGFDAAHDGFFWLAGHGGYGIQTSPALSQLASNLLLGKTVDTHLAEGLSPSRTMIKSTP